MNNKTPLAVLTLLTLSLSVANPANAQWNWGDSRGLNGTKQQLQAQIDQAYQSGRITQAQSIPLQTRLNEIGTLEAQYRNSGGRLSGRERASLEQKLDVLANQIRAELRSNGTAGGGGSFGGRGGGRWNWGNNGSNINATQKKLQAQIDRAYQSGRITQAESIPLQTRLNEIGALEAQFRTTGGRLSSSERSNLEQKLNRLADAIERELNDYDGRWNRKHGKGNWKNR